MAFPKNLLNEREELVLDLRPHWISLLLPGVYSLMAAVIGIGLFFIGVDGAVGTARTIISVILIVGGLGFFGWKYMVWNSTMFVLTSDRILSRRGVLTKSGIEIPLERINTVFFEQGVFERMIGAGDLAIESAGERGTETFDDVRKPAVVQKEIYVQMEANENRKFDRISGGFAQAQPTGHDLASQIEKLAELHQKGVLSDAEYTLKKQELLDRM